MAKLSCISFDVWNTLLKLEPVYEALAASLAEDTGRRSDEVMKHLLEAGREARHRRRRSGFLTVEESLEVLSAHLDTPLPVVRHAIAKAFAKLEVDHLVIESVREVFENLKRLNLRLTVAGNVLWWPGWYTRLLLAKTGILDYLDDSVFADEVEESKPSPRFFEIVASRLGCSVRELMHVGDRPDEDLAGALAAGAYAVLVNRDLQPPVIVRLGRRVFAVPRLTDVVKVVEEIRD